MCRGVSADSWPFSRDALIVHSMPGRPAMLSAARLDTKMRSSLAHAMAWLLWAVVVGGGVGGCSKGGSGGCWCLGQGWGLLLHSLVLGPPARQASPSQSHCPVHPTHHPPTHPTRT